MLSATTVAAGHAATDEAATAAAASIGLPLPPLPIPVGTPVGPHSDLTRALHPTSRAPPTLVAGLELFIVFVSVQ